MDTLTSLFLLFLVFMRDLCRGMPTNVKTNIEAKRRGKISVNLSRLVWEFEEGGELGKDSERQQEEKARSTQA